MCRKCFAIQAGIIVLCYSVLPGAQCSGDVKPPSASRPATSQSAATQPATQVSQPAHWPPVPPAARQYVERRRAMVKTQIAHPRDDRTPVRDKRVLQAMRAVPRHVFIPQGPEAQAYADHPLPIGYGQTISQPYIVALMTELLRLTPESKVLEIGTGSGYQAAVLAHLTPHVYTIEIVEPLGKWSASVLKQQKYDTVCCRVGDGYLGWPEAAPFDGIIVTCAAEDLPQPLWNQLKCGGRIVIPVGGPGRVQRLVVITKTTNGKRESETITWVRFVPMTGKQEKEGD